MKRRNALIIIFLYAFLQLLLLIFHEPWGDEAQAWLIARDLPFWEIPRQMSYEGSPALWHLILSPFARAGFPYVTMAVINFIVMIGFAIVWLFYSPFSSLTKILLLFSYFFGFEYPVIARSYGLGILLLMVCAVYYTKRFTRPFPFAIAVALLANTNPHSFVMAGVLGSLYLWQVWHARQWHRRVIIALGIMIFGGILAFIQIHPAADAAFLRLPDERYYWYLSAIHQAFLPSFWPYKEPIFFVLSFLILIIAWLSLSKRPAALFLFSTGTVGIFYIFSFYFGGPRHSGLLFMWFVFCVWVADFSLAPLRSPLEKFRIVLPLCLVLSLPVTWQMQQSEFCCKFSSAKEMANYIQENVSSPIIVAHRSERAEALLPYLPEKNFWYAGIRQFGTYIIWNQEWYDNYDIPTAEVFLRSRESFFKAPPVLLDEPAIDPAAHGYGLSYQITDVFVLSKERYYLYEPL